MTAKVGLTSKGKRYQDAVGLVDSTRFYPPEEAFDLLKKTATAKFDETLECHIRTPADPRHADQLIRSVVMLPYGTGKTRLQCTPRLQIRL